MNKQFSSYFAIRRLQTNLDFLTTTRKTLRSGIVASLFRSTNSPPHSSDFTWTNNEGSSSSPPKTSSKTDATPIIKDFLSAAAVSNLRKQKAHLDSPRYFRTLLLLEESVMFPRGIATSQVCACAWPLTFFKCEILLTAILVHKAAQLLLLSPTPVVYFLVTPVVYFQRLLFTSL